MYIEIYTYRFAFGDDYTGIFFYISLLLMRSDESADNVKSSWPVQVGLHICYNEDIKNRALYLR